MLDKVVAGDELLAEAKRWILEEGNAVQPWDKKGFEIPGGGPWSSTFKQMFTAANAMLHANVYDNYPAPKAILSCVYEGSQVAIDVGLQIENRWFVSLILDSTSGNMVRTLFLNMQEARKGAARPADVPKTEIKKIGVLGAGLMGAGIAFVSAKAGIDVVLIDISQENAEKGKAYSEKRLDKAISRGRIDRREEGANPRTHHSDDGLRAARGRRPRRRGRVRRPRREGRGHRQGGGGPARERRVRLEHLDAADHGPRRGVLATGELHRPALLLPGREDAAGRGHQGREDLGRSAREVDGLPGADRQSPGRRQRRPRLLHEPSVFGTYVNEGIGMLVEGVNPALIENAGKQTGMPMAPLALADEVGIDLMYHVGQQTKKDLGDDYKPVASGPVIEKMTVDLERPGRKGSGGFYAYPEGGKKHLWDGLTEHYPVAEEQPTLDEVKKRFLYTQALETARCFDEGVIADPAAADVGAILGWGFAPYTGGPCSMIDTIGARNFVQECDALAAKYGERFESPKFLRDMAERNGSFY